MDHAGCLLNSRATPDTIRDLVKTAIESFPDGYVLMDKKQFL